MKKQLNLWATALGLSILISGISGCINIDNDAVSADAAETASAPAAAHPAATAEQPTSDLESMKFAAPEIEFKSPEDPAIIRTPEGANALDLETPLRCNVNWKTQQMVLTLPYINSAFKLERNGRNDPLPRFEVTGYTFDMMPAEQALVKLTKDAGIRVSSAD